jgi:accessory colonization factor AcfC
LFIISSASAFTLGYQQSTNASKNNIHLIQSYAEMEKAIIDNYEKELYEKKLDTLTIRESVNPKSVKHLRYYDKNGLLVRVN